MAVNEPGGELRLDYDSKSLKLRQLSAEHKSYGKLIRLDADVAATFPDSESVNDALRYLIRLGKLPVLVS